MFFGFFSAVVFRQCSGSVTAFVEVGCLRSLSPRLTIGFGYLDGSIPDRCRIIVA